MKTMIATPDQLHSIALFRLSAMGDVMLMTPVIRAIQNTYPEAEIFWIIGKPAYALLQGMTGVNFIVIDKPRSIIDYWRLYQRFKTYRFDVLLAAQASLRANLIYPLIHAPVKIGFDSQRAKDGHQYFINQSIPFRKAHLLDGFMQFAEAIGAEKVIDWQLPISSDDQQWAKSTLLSNRRWVAINPSASKKERNWLLTHYVALIEVLCNQWNVNVVLTGGPGKAEKQLAADIMTQCTTDCLNLTGETSFKQLAAVLSQVDLMIAPDTGPLHIAVAVGTSVIGLYAVAPPELSGPYSQNAAVINKFPEAVATFLNQSAEDIPWGTRVHDQNAMALINVEDVVALLPRFLS